MISGIASLIQASVDPISVGKRIFSSTPSSEPTQTNFKKATEQKNTDTTSFSLEALRAAYKLEENQENLQKEKTQESLKTSPSSNSPLESTQQYQQQQAAQAYHNAAHPSSVTSPSLIITV